MQHNKITDNLGEFQKFIDSENKTGMCLEDTIKFFDIQRIFGRFEFVKQSGIRVTMIMTTLLVMLFYRSRNIHSYFQGNWREIGVRIHTMIYWVKSTSTGARFCICLLSST